MSPRALALALLLVGGNALAAGDEAQPRATLDRVAVRYYAPETGGAARPRYVSERLLAFEARLEALGEQTAASDSYEDRFVRAALDRHVAEDMLSSLAVKSGTLPKDLTPYTDEEQRGLVERVGGEAALHRAMDAEGIDDVDLHAMLRRRVRAAWYVDRALTPLLRPSDEQLREVFRTSAHPFKQMSFEEARPALARWFMEERLRAAETTFLQAARARLHVVVVTRPDKRATVVSAP